MPVSRESAPAILAIVRESPIRQRTVALLHSIMSQEPAGVAEVVLLRLRAGTDLDAGSGAGRVRQVSAEADWSQQALRLIEASGCRWVVLPSSVDRYLPGAFETAAKLGGDEDEAIVFGCRVKRGGRTFRIGPNPFRFDYFALLSGFNYIAPGGVFISAQRFMAAGGFDPRFPNAFTYEYLLRAGVAHRVACGDGPCLETEAHPFPGVPTEYAALYAIEASLVALHYNRFVLTPRATLALVEVLAERLELAGYGGRDDRLAEALAAGRSSLTERYLKYVGMEEEGRSEERAADPRHVTARGRPGSRRDLRPSAFFEGPDEETADRPEGLVSRVAVAIRAVTPQPAWNTLRRAKRAWTTWSRPLD
jgi:hypothetical protein